MVLKKVTFTQPECLFTVTMFTTIRHWTYLVGFTLS